MLPEEKVLDLSVANKLTEEDKGTITTPVPRAINNSPGIQKLRALLNKTLRIEMSDGRVLIGIFLCTDAEANVILGSCSEYLPQELKSSKTNEEPRMLGLVMIPGKHIVTVSKDLNDPPPTSACNPSFDFQVLNPNKCE